LVGCEAEITVRNINNQRVQSWHIRFNFTFL